MPIIPELLSLLLFHEVVSNIPFNISTDVIKQLLPLGDIFSKVILLLQEAALRFVDSSLRTSEFDPSIFSSTFTQLMWNKMLAKKETTNMFGNRFACDGDKNLYTVGPLPQNNFEFTVVLQESFPEHGSPPHNGSPVSLVKGQSILYKKTFKVKICYAAEIPLKSISLSLQRADPDNVQDALRVLDVILRQQAPNWYLEISPFKVSFEAKRMLKNLRNKTRHNKKEFKIKGLSNKPCNQLFISIEKQLTQGDGRVLEAPKVEVDFLDPV
ncbi:unnamed protein product [Ilex paraguariensis]|uniref:Protein argonaute N-terminal domain-containing protein n=1 Tax=Ilex paraguariensis TaxID=185542 RepID=A0ABC8RDV5_9AQUA